MGKLLSQQYKVVLDDMVEFIKEMEMCMSRQIRDLDDVRTAMICLDKIRDQYIGYILFSIFG